MEKAHAEKGFYERETRFYAELGDNINVRTPIVYHTDMDLSAGDHVLLLEDLQYLLAGDQVLGCNEGEARAAMRYLSALHSSWWNDDRLDSIPWLLDTGMVEFYGQAAELYTKVYEPGLDRLSDWLPPGIEGMARQLMPTIPWFFKTVSSEPRTLCHRDFRLGNLFFSSGNSGDDVEVAAVDWEQVGPQRGAAEVAYFMCWSLDTEDRRRIKPGLLQEYHAGLLAGGVHDYSYENFMLDYRTGLLRNLFTLLIVVGNLPEDRYRDDITNSAIFKPMAIRMQTLIDWDCDELIPG